jgi:hypothetical protein
MELRPEPGSGCKRGAQTAPKAAPRKPSKLGCRIAKKK